MLKHLKNRTLLSLLSFIIGLLYLYLTHVTITQKDPNHFTLYSSIPQKVTLHIRTKNPSASFQCNQTPYPFPQIAKHDYWYKGEEQLTLSLKRGENSCSGQELTGEIRQKIGYFEGFILFLLLILPLYGLLFSTIQTLIDREKKKRTITPMQLKWYGSGMLSHPLLLLILLLGVTVRLFYFNKYGVVVFQHDWQGHINFIKYMAENWSLPIPTKGWEYPQQPLYYLILGYLYNLSSSMGYSESETMIQLGYISLLSSALFLYYGYRFVLLLTDNRVVQLTAITFISLTPSLVYMSTRINNDALVMALAVMTLYSLLKSFQSNFRDHFYRALLLVSLLFLTKISTLSIELLFFTLLLIGYYHATPERTQQLKKQLYLFGLVGIFLLSFTLLHNYLPLDSTFHMVNSAKFPKQTLDSLGFDYFGTFHLIELIQKGESHVFGLDAIRHSFLTYQYGTMLFGEFDYSYFTNKNGFLHPTMQVIYLLATLFIVGFISYLVNFRKESLISKLLFMTLTINFILVIRFIFLYPSICNTDFRYLVSSFAILAFLFGRGLYYLSGHKVIRRVIQLQLILLILSELLFFIFLIYP